MVRAPCCEKIGLKKGSWAAEEDRILMVHIQKYGHGNWRSLPKQAGLFRCGKSCRLRWINYLRPDLKRGNFTVEEEETIIKLHEKFGNRWSAIAAELPGRTDNEIKNVWHTYLKKRLDGNNSSNNSTEVRKQKPAGNPSKGPMGRRSRNINIPPVSSEMNTTTGGASVNWFKTSSNNSSTSSGSSTVLDPQQLSHSSSDVSSIATRGYQEEEDELFQLEIPEIDDNFLSETLPMEQDITNGDFADYDDAMPMLSNGTTDWEDQNTEDDMDFWLRVFIESGSDDSS